MAEATPAGSGAAPVPVPSVDGMLRIRGGVGGLSFQFEELLAGASALDGIVRELAAVDEEAEAVRRALFPYQYDSYTSGSNAITAVGEAARDVRRVRMELERLGSAVRASHREYEFAEARNNAGPADRPDRPGVRAPVGAVRPASGHAARHRRGRGRAGAGTGWRCYSDCPPARPRQEGPTAA